MKRLTPIAVLAAIAALVIALTSSATSKPHKTAQTGAPTGAQAGTGPYGGGRTVPAPATAANSAIGIRSTPLGSILVDAKGRTLYLFEADKTNVSNCTGPCLSIWPALTPNGKPKADAGVLAAKIATTATTGGKRQVTYNGHPLYYYAGDQKAGDTTGQGLKQFGAAWYVLAATGNKIDNG
jgi:predicted lipoprotein with Yx(FWY)xxD motif